MEGRLGGSGQDVQGQEIHGQEGPSQEEDPNGTTAREKTVSADEDRRNKAESEFGISVYGEFIKDELEREIASRSSLEQRAFSVITTSGVLVTLLFGLVAIVTSKPSFVLPPASAGWLKRSMISFVVAAVLGIVTNFPFLRRGALPNDLASVVENDWRDSPSEAQRATADACVDILKNAVLLNKIKGFALAAAMVAEVVAVVFVAFGVAAILRVG